MWFHDSAADIDFYQMSLSQSITNILHESTILLFVIFIENECVILVSLSKLMNIKLSWNACIHVQLLIRKTIPVSI